MNVAKWAFSIVCLSAFGLASVAEAGPRHPSVRRHNGGGAFSRNVVQPVYQYQAARQYQQPRMWSNVAPQAYQVVQPAQPVQPVQSARQIQVDNCVR